MQLRDPVSSVPKQPLLETVPTKVVRDSLYPTESIVATQSETRRIYFFII